MLKKYLICSGTGFGRSELNSFDEALRNSGVANYNLVKVSSILPANAERKSRVTIPEGSVLYTAYANITSTREGDVVSAAIAVGIPVNKGNVGIIMEYSGRCTEKEAHQAVCSMVDDAMKSRGYEIEEIFCVTSSVESHAGQFATAFAALSMWE